MRMNSKPIAEKKSLLMKHLRDQGFVVAQTQHGFTAVDEDGVVFTVSPVRTHVCIVHPKSGKYHELRARGMPDPKWFDQFTDHMVQFSKES